MSSTSRTWQDPNAPDPNWAAPAAAGLHDQPNPPEEAPTEHAPTQAVDPEWADPEGPPARRRSRWLTLGAPILVVVLVFALVWGLGGFERRKDVLITKAPGDLLVSMPFEFTFTKATAQLKTDFDESQYWEVIMIGEGRNTGDKSLAPHYLGDYGTFVARDKDTPEVQSAESITIGGGSSIMLRASTFTPGLPAQPFSVTFRFSDKYEPDDVVTFGVFQQEFSDTSLIGEDEPTWNNSTYAYLLDLPVEQLPAETE